MKRKVAPCIVSAVLLISILACSLTFQPDGGEPEASAATTSAPLAASSTNTALPSPAPATPTNPPMPSATWVDTATLPALPTLTPSSGAPPTATALATIVFTPTSSFSGVAPGYHMVKIHNRYPFTIYFYLDGLYLMGIPTMKFMTYNGIKAGTHTFTFAKRNKRRPVQILTERIVEVSGFTEMWVSP